MNFFFVHSEIKKIQSPARIQTHATKNSVPFLITGSDLRCLYTGGQKMLLLSFLRRIVFITLPHQVLLLDAL